MVEGNGGAEKRAVTDIGLLTVWAKNKVQDIFNGRSRSDKPLEHVERIVDVLNDRGHITQKNERDIMGYYGNVQGWFASASHNDRVGRLAYWIYLEDCKQRGVQSFSSELRFVGDLSDPMMDDWVEPWKSIAEGAINDYEREQNSI
ncbi:MAG: hypothetical protein Q8P56_01815 [Candidatus Uhrbacteria bacterium]|nr:hypothetical protein [Candidatus Uhrbacteria bacterium]